MKTTPYYIGLLLLACMVSCTESKYAPALSPEASMATFDLHGDFEIELFAAEPHIKDPVDLVFDEQGHAYAIEMPDYPYKPAPGEGRGVIKKLVDTDGDGTVDASSTFAEGLPDATSLMPWKGGFLVTSAPHILYLKDSNGDGKADIKEIIFSGFFDNNSEAQVTNLRLGVDNWIYAANNGQRSEVVYNGAKGAIPLNLQGADFRFRLDKGEYERESGTAQFGQSFDDWGNKFFTQNTLHLQQAVIPMRYLERHGLLPSLSVNQNISDHDLEMFQMTPPPYWRAERTRRRNQQYQEQGLDRVEHAEKHFTGASGGTVYVGGVFPDSFYGNIFTGDVAGNLVHRDRLIPDKNGPTMVATRPAEETSREFLASTDPWFRPVGFTVGPDGFLYMVDFYRQHIETPVSIPDDLKEEMDFMHGEDHGRIYRIRPKNPDGEKLAAKEIPNYGAEQLVGLLAHNNGWWRTTAQRLILEAPKREMIPELVKMAKDHPDERARLHSLFLLESMGKLTEELVLDALKSDHDGLVKNALILAEKFPDLKEHIRSKTQHPSPQVAFQATLSLGTFEDQSITETMGNQIMQWGLNKWFRTAVLSSNAGSGVAMLKFLKEKHDFLEDEEDWKKEFIGDLAQIISSRGDHEALSEMIGLVMPSAGEPANTWMLVSKEGIKKGLNSGQNRAPKISELLEKSDLPTTSTEKWMLELKAAL
jgi:putative membrane-bound dehydrogenase-like protein